MKLRPVKGNIFVRPFFDNKRTGLIHTEFLNPSELPTEGIVVAIGGRRLTKKGAPIEHEFGIGDRVIFKKFSGTMVEFNGETLIRTYCHEVQAVITNE